jgi:hypothetical protein
LRRDSPIASAQQQYLPKVSLLTTLFFVLSRGPPTKACHDKTRKELLVQMRLIVEGAESVTRACANAEASTHQ